MVRPSLSVEIAEAFAEYLLKPISGKFGFTTEESRDPDARAKAITAAVTRSATPPAHIDDQKQLSV